MPTMPRRSRTICPAPAFAPTPRPTSPAWRSAARSRTCWLSAGLGFGANTRIALITRGLVEMTRLGVALGAQRETFMGLAGLGDLVLTCTDDHSRNRRFGLALAQGTGVELALFDIGQVVEGFHAAKALRRVAAREHVVMPIAEGIYGVLFEQLPAEHVVRGLMMRPIRPEFD